MTKIAIKRAYDPPAASDGFRVLVDRLWPRGISKAVAHIDLWAKEIAPTTALREEFCHDPARWKLFQKHYRAELAEPERRERLREVVAAAGAERTITLVYGAKDREHNQAVVLQQVFERLVKGRTNATKSAQTGKKA